MFGFRRSNNTGVLAPTIKQVAANSAVTYAVGDALVLTSGKLAKAGATVAPEYIAAQGGLGKNALSVYQVEKNQEWETTLSTAGSLVVGVKYTRKRGRNGGIKSGETRRARKTMKETILAMLSQELKPEQIEQYGIDPSTLNGDYTYQSALIASMLREALNGSERAAQLLRDTIDEAPTNRQEIRQEVITADDLQTIDNLKRYLTS